MNFIASKSADYKFLLDDSATDEGMNRSHEDNLVMTELITDEITQVTNAYQKSNYTFKLIKQSDLDGKYFLNLVVKEYMDTFYLYIVKYVPDTFWLSTHSLTKDLGDFTGMVYFYSDKGIYVAKVTMQNGSSIASERHPCDDPEDDGTNGGDDGSGGGSGCTMTYVWYECNGTNSNIPHSAESCGGSSGGGSGYYWVESGDCVGNKSMNEFLRHPCEGSGSGGATGGGNSYCQPDPDCVLPMQLDENCDCAEPEEIENGDVGVVAPNYGKDINICLGNTFTVDETNTLNENSAIEQLYDYVFDDFGNCNPENPEFAELAAEALLEGSEVDFEDNIINSLTNECAKYIFWGIEGSSIEPSILDSPNVEPLTFTDIILDLFNDNTGLTYTIQNSNIPNSQTTTAPSIVTTSLSNTYLENATQLSIARTMIHELVHAYLLALYYNPVTTNSLEFFNLMQDYAEDNGLNIDDDNSFHHEFMGQYVDAMAYSLYLWDRDYGTGGNLGWNYYWSMAFGGLYTQDPISGAINYTDSFIELVPNEEDREDIINIIINEQNGTSDAEGSTCE